MRNALDLFAVLYMHTVVFYFSIHNCGNAWKCCMFLVVESALWLIAFVRLGRAIRQWCALFLVEERGPWDSREQRRHCKVYKKAVPKVMSTNTPIARSPPASSLTLIVLDSLLRSQSFSTSL